MASLHQASDPASARERIKRELMACGALDPSGADLALESRLNTGALTTTFAVTIDVIAQYLVLLIQDLEFDVIAIRDTNLWSLAHAVASTLYRLNGHRVRCVRLAPSTDNPADQADRGRALAVAAKQHVLILVAGLDAYLRHRLFDDVAALTHNHAVMTAVVSLVNGSHATAGVSPELDEFGVSELALVSVVTPAGK